MRGDKRLYRPRQRCQTELGGSLARSVPVGEAEGDPLCAALLFLLRLRATARNFKAARCAQKNSAEGGNERGLALSKRKFFPAGSGLDGPSKLTLSGSRLRQRVTAECGQRSLRIYSARRLALKRPNAFDLNVLPPPPLDY